MSLIARVVKWWKKRSANKKRIATRRKNAATKNPKEEKSNETRA
jgi:hypothetical protein